MDGYGREVSSAWGSASTALDLLKSAQMQIPISLPCDSLNRLLLNALRPGGAILEVSGLPGTGKTQFCLQVCAAAQLSALTSCNMAPHEAIYIDAEGSFMAARYAQICRALLENSISHVTDGDASRAAILEQTLRNMHVCRTYDATELYASVKHLGDFLKSHIRVRVIVIDSLAFCFRHEFNENMAQRARILTDIAATLRRYGAAHNLLVLITNHMTTRFDRSSDGDVGYLTPALGETWPHQASTHLRLERVQRGSSGQPLGRATITKSVEQPGATCLFQITEAGVRDSEMRF